MEMSLEDLMDIEITSASKKKQKIAETAAAVFVITQEDIRRSGVTSIPEALRMVPGLQVARIDANKWAVTSRGFSAFAGRFANKLLVLVDGRSVYTPLFSGTFWELQDTMLEDIERIEVIRGPGATLWGANAVNGVINIMTKKARDTQGGLVTAGAGTEERGFGSLRYGGQLSEDACYRMYAKYFDRDAAVDTEGNDAADDWDALRAGFRIDREASARDALTVQGDFFDVGAGETVTTAVPEFPSERTLVANNDYRGGNLTGRWKRTLAGSSGLELQVYYDRVEYNTSYVGTIVDTYDIDFQHHFWWGKKQEIIWGLGYRYIHDEIDNTYAVALHPDSDQYDLFSFFLQDDITLIADRLNLILGSKFEHNDFTGFEIQPNARLVWQPDGRQAVWAAVSRAVRTPSRGEADNDIRMPLMFPGTEDNPLLLPIQPRIAGDSDFDSEKLVAYELGYRLQPADCFSFDMALFFNDYSDLQYGRLLEPRLEFLPSLYPFPPYLIAVSTMEAANQLEGETYGVEVAADWRIAKWWRLQPAYTFLQMNLQANGGIGDDAVEEWEGRSPQHQFSLRSSMELAKRLELDLWGRYVDSLPGLDVEYYITMDVRLGWHPSEKIELALVGQNLFDDQHLEFEPQIFDTAATEVERSLYAKITLKF